MAKLEQNRHGLFPGGNHGSTGGPGTGKFINTVKRISNNVKRKAGDIVSNVKDKIETRKNEKATEELAAMGSSKNPRFLQDALNPAQNAAMTAGGSRPMTAMNNPQIDPITGMPITPGGQPNMNPNFIGGMANSNMPTTGMLAQEKYNAELADVNGNGVTEDWEEANAKKFTVAQEKKMSKVKKLVRKGEMNPDEAFNKGYVSNAGYDKLVTSRAYKKQRADEAGYKSVRKAKKAAKANDGFLPEAPANAKIPQEKSYMRTMKPLVKYPSATYSNYKDFRGDMQKATIDDSTFTSDSTKFKAGINPKYKLDMNKSYNYNLENNPKAVEFSERMTPEINQSRRSTKCMRVKKR